MHGGGEGKEETLPILKISPVQRLQRFVVGIDRLRLQLRGSSCEEEQEFAVDVAIEFPPPPKEPPRWWSGSSMHLLINHRHTHSTLRAQDWSRLRIQSLLYHSQGPLGKDYFRTTIFFPANFVTLLAVI